MKQDLPSGHGGGGGAGLREKSPECEACANSHSFVTFLFCIQPPR